MNYKIRIITSISVLLVGAASLSGHVFASDEIVVSGNGSDSSNTAAVASSPQTSVQQSNTAVINNTVTTTSNTGGNAASNNTGGNTQVATGDVTTHTQVNNQANTATATVSDCGCSNQGSSVSVSGNGTGSQNTASVTENNSTTVTVQQTTTIVNNVKGYANTGNNSANNNNGDISIKTGNIFSHQEVNNGPLNVSDVNVSQALNSNNLVKVAGNGSNSTNTLDLHHTNNVILSIFNNNDVINNLLMDLNTGENSANENVGNVTIATGDVLSEVVISTAANSSKIDVSCGCEKQSTTPSPSQPSAPAPSTTTSSPSSSSSSSSSSTTPGQVLNAAVGSLLPATGANWMLLGFVGNIIMLFLGMYLRLRSGRSPGFLLAF